MRELVTEVRRCRDLVTKVIKGHSVDHLECFGSVECPGDTLCRYVANSIRPEGQKLLFFEAIQTKLQTENIYKAIHCPLLEP